jgi:hypothetical protein
MQDRIVHDPAREFRHLLPIGGIECFFGDTVRSGQLRVHGMLSLMRDQAAANWKPGVDLESAISSSSISVSIPSKSGVDR